MDEKATSSGFTFLNRRYRTMDAIVIATTFTLMTAMFFLTRHLNFVDLLILNLDHSLGVFMAERDWRDGGSNIVFGLVYLMTTFKLSSMLVAIPCICAVVVTWMVTCHRFGYPHVFWMFLFCLVMWVMKFLYRRPPDGIVAIALMKTARNYVNNENKSLVDLIVVVSFILLHVALFAVEEVAINYLILSYVLSFIWMWGKSSV